MDRMRPIAITATIVSAFFTFIILVLVAGEWASGYGGLKSDVNTLRGDVTELRQDVQELRQEVRDLGDNLRDDIRMSRSEIIDVIEAHEHELDSGEVVFRRSP